MAEELQFEYDVKTIPVESEEQFRGAIQAMQDEGWQIVQGVKPVTIYHVIRQKPQPKTEAGGGIGVIRIDDSKVMILRKDGTVDKGAANE